MAPLTPDHHFYIDQGANAHVRLVLVAIGRKLAAAGASTMPEDVMFLRYNELRALIGDAAAHRRRARRRGAQGRAREGLRVPPARLDRHRDADASSTSRTSSTGASPRSSRARKREIAEQIIGIGGSPGVVEGIARVVSTRTSSTTSAPATSSSAT
jgi:hypothetical protein